MHAIDDASAATTCDLGPVRHSSAGGINLQAQRRRSAGLADRRPDQARQPLARLAHR